MQTQLRVLQSEQAKRKSANKVGAATEELQYLMNFSTSIKQCVAKAMEHLSDFTFVSMARVTSGLKQDTLAALRQASLDLPTLFPESVLKRAEDDIGRFEEKGRCHGQSGVRRDNRFHPYRWSDRQTQEQRSGRPAWKQLGHFNSKKRGGRQSNQFSSRLARGQLSYK